MKKKLKIVFALVFAAIMAIQPLSVAFAAEDDNGNTSVTAEERAKDDANIDDEKTGSITLYKYQSKDGKTIEGTGYYAPADDLTGVVNEPQDGAQFYYRKVADIDQVNVSSTDAQTGLVTTQARTYYTNVDAGFLALLLEATPSLAPDYTETLDGGATKDYYTANQLNSALTAEIHKHDATSTGEERLDDYGAQGTAFALTDNNGMTTKNQLPLGLYLITEARYPNNLEYTGDTPYSGFAANNETSRMASSIASPSLVALPMTNQVTIPHGNEDGTDAAPGTVWQYDIVIYPKNSMISLRKDWVADGNDTADYDASRGTSGSVTTLEDETGNVVTTEQPRLVTETDKNVGDVLTAVLTMDVQALLKDTQNDRMQGSGANQGVRVEEDYSKAYTELVITDVFSKGLTFRDTEDRQAWTIDQNAKQELVGQRNGANGTGTTEGRGVQITLGTANWDADTNAVLVFGTDYTVSSEAPHMIEDPAHPGEMIADPEGHKEIVFTFTQAGLDKLTAITVDSMLYIKYTCVVNKDAAEENKAIKEDTNEATAVFSTDGLYKTQIKSNNIKVYNYEINIAKSFTDTHFEADNGDVDASNNRTLADTTRLPIDYTKVKFSVTAISGYDDFRDQLQFVEESAGVYHLADYAELHDANVTKTIEVSPDAAGNLALKGLDARDYVITEDATIPGYNLLRDKITVHFEKAHPENGKLDSATIQSGSDAAASITTDLNNGVVSFAIRNNEVVTPLRTGGSGWFVSMGMGVAAMGTGLFFLLKKKKEEEQQVAA